MKFKQGDVVYWVERSRYSSYEYLVKYGLVDEEFSDAVCIDRLHLYDNRLIDGVPYNNCPEVGKWQKLPKGWTYDTVLFKVDWQPLFEIFHDVDKDEKWTGSPEQIKYLFEKGVLIYLRDYSQTVPHTEIDKKLGWRIRKETLPFGEYVCSSLSMPKDKVYFTYNEAQAEIDAIETEWKRQSELTDEEWSKEEIEKNLDRWKVVYGKSLEDVDRIRNWLFSKEKIDMIETRVYMGEFQWKYENKKKWMSIDPDSLE